jgi:hypothetical protein
MVSLIFLVRNVGTAPILGLKPELRFPAGGDFTLKCLEYGPEMHLLGETPDKCSAPVEKIPPINPVPSGMRVPTAQEGGGLPDFVISAVVTAPSDIPQFDISVELLVDNLPPIYYRIQCMRWADMSPYAE